MLEVISWQCVQQRPPLIDRFPDCRETAQDVSIYIGLSQYLVLVFSRATTVRFAILYSRTLSTTNVDLCILKIYLIINILYKLLNVEKKFKCMCIFSRDVLSHRWQSFRGRATSWKARVKAVYL